MRRTSTAAGRALLLCACLAIPAPGCVSKTEPVSTVRSPGASVAPALAVERFLNAANARDLDTMARLFGTKDGSILKRDPRAEVEQRMYALASVLRHDNYSLEGEGPVPGRLGEAVRLIIRMHINERVVDVPFIVVQTKKDGWLVEQIDIEKITMSR